MATLRNKTTSKGVIVRWKPYPDHNRPSTYQVKSRAVSFLGELGFSVPNQGDEVDVPWDICRPLRVLGDLHFKSNSTGEVETDDIGEINEDFAQDLSESQREELRRYIATHDNYQKQSSTLAGEISSLPEGEEENDESIDLYKNQLQEGDRFVATIDRISNSGNGIVNTNESHINIGPVKSNADGTKVAVEMYSGASGICITESVRAENYTSNFWRANRHQFHKFGKDTIDSAMFCEECGSVALKSGKKWECGTCGSTFPSDDAGESGVTIDLSIAEVPDPGEVVNGVTVVYDSENNFCAKREKRIKIVGDQNIGSEVDVEIQSRRAGYVVAKVVDLSDENTSLFSEDSTTQKSLDELRKEAEEAATDNVSVTVSKSSSTTIRYSRSQEIKDYVKARADGVCEGCNEPAPFTDKSGDPYLQVHHIHELSDGGSDAPENVVALCPNCHYRVHHGQDGESYNQELSSESDEQNKDGGLSSLLEEISEDN